MIQTKLESLIERAADIATGFVISVLLYKHIILPNEWLLQSPVLVTVLFTVISFGRGYMWRRFFNAGLHRVVHEVVGRMVSRNGNFFK